MRIYSVLRKNSNVIAEVRGVVKPLCLSSRTVNHITVTRSVELKNCQAFLWKSCKKISAIIYVKLCQQLINEILNRILTYWLKDKNERHGNYDETKSPDFGRFCQLRKTQMYNKRHHWYLRVNNATNCHYLVSCFQYYGPLIPNESQNESETFLWHLNFFSDLFIGSLIFFAIAFTFFWCEWTLTRNYKKIAALSNAWTCLSQREICFAVDVTKRKSLLRRYSLKGVFTLADIL